MSVDVTQLRAIGIKGHYRSDREDVVQEFYVPCLTAAVSYSRAVGYFTSTSLAIFARGIENLGVRGGTMRLIASPHLNSDDITDIERGYDLREVLQRATLRELEGDDPDSILNGLGIVGRMIAEEHLDIKLAFVQRAGKIGIYHEKIGLFRDGSGDLVAFTGSANETLGGLMTNFESVEVFAGWQPGDGPRALRIEEDFENLWKNMTPNLRVEPFPDVARDRLIELGRRPSSRFPEDDSALIPVVDVSPPLAAHLAIPSHIEPRRYQKQAVDAWLRNRGQGILKMATGTGKTKTALMAAYQLAQALKQREQPLAMLVLAPLQHLVDQWISEVEAFGVRAIGVYESSQRWVPMVEDQLSEARLGQRPVVVMVATNASFSGERFQSILSRITQPLLVIADEAHNLGASTYRSFLPQNATYRMALSATPERWFDDEGTDALTSFFGRVVFELGLGRAIDMGALCRYEYLPQLIELTEDEGKLYADVTTKIARRLGAGEALNDNDPDSPIGFLLRQRAGILGHAEGKLPVLRADLQARRDAWYQLVYCAEGRRPVEAGEPAGPNQLAETMEMLGHDLKLTAHPYVSETPRTERRVLMRRFGSGDDLRILVAMRCLDEGVDIPDARVGYLLASSSNPRQFIQRRGRLLRPAPGKNKAHIIDYIAIPNSSSDVSFEAERSLLKRELERANEFGKLAENYEATLRVLRPLKEKYHLMDL